MENFGKNIKKEVKSGRIVFFISELILPKLKKFKGICLLVTFFVVFNLEMSSRLAINLFYARNSICVINLRILKKNLVKIDDSS